MDYKQVLDTITDYVGNYYGFPYDQAQAQALRDSLSSGQLGSKVRVAQTIAERTPGQAPFRGFFIGHWHGFLPRLLYRMGKLQLGAGVELDPFWVDFSNRLNQDWQWLSSCADIRTVQDLSAYNLVVNTSCEHMTDEWLTLPAVGSWVCAQSTNYQHATHINTSDSLESFASRFTGYQIVHQCTDQYVVYDRYTVLAVKL